MGKISKLPSAGVRSGISAPAPIADHHDVSGFESGEPTLDNWLRDHARSSEGRTARTYVIAADNRVIGFYTLSTGSIRHAEAPGRLRRNTPDPIPVVLLARLAVALTYQGTGLGAALLREVLSTTVTAAQAVGVRAILVHALSDSAKAFYQKYGFIQCPVDPGTLALPIETAIAALAAAQG